MKIKFATCLTLILFCTFSGYSQTDIVSLSSIKKNQTTSSNTPIPDDWYNEAVRKIDQLDYAFAKKKLNNDYVSYNKNSGFDYTINEKGMIVKNNVAVPGKTDWKTSFSLTSISKGETTWNNNDFLNAKLDASKLQFVHRHFAIEYINDKTGMRQNFIINEKPTGDEELKVNLALGNSLDYELKDNYALYCYDKKISKNNPQLIYDGLKVWDANGTVLEAHMELAKNNLSIVVDDKNAVYPVTVDPLSHSPEWTTSANGILPALLTNTQLQIDALYGFNVAGLGDVNGDGYDDVAIGAPGAIDIISAPATVVGAGAVFVYFGTPAGLSTTPNKVLRSTTPVVNALFGYSVAGGNVTGNSKNDIIVGAPGESYTTAVSGTPATATVTAGKVYVFAGEDITGSAPSPVFSLYLNGSAYFSRGVAMLLGSNITINALFGFSVAATEDMTGDGLGEIIVGAPGYAELALLPVRSGAAVVFYSSNLAVNVCQKLTAPTSSLLGIPALNTGGLLFGFSVDGLGDYNQDGKPDVVVGAPAGVSLTLGNLLGGSAYVYKGTGSGVNPAAITQLKATPSLIGTLTNLFGYSVRGVRNANGTRNGNIIIGAPSGNLLSNVVGGLKLKMGSVNVFKSKSSPSAAEVPAQAFQSPRGSSLLSVLSGLNLSVSALFGASIDNMLDVNCDGINDIIVGEPLSTAVGMISVNAVGGAATVFLGKADGTYNTTPYWNLENQMSYNAGINAGSLLGYSVAGAGHVRGKMQSVRCIVGAPGAALDFSSGIFNLTGTLGTLFSFTAGNNGLGKSYMFGFSNCGVTYNPDINVTYVNVPVPGDVHTNDIVPIGTTYGTPIPAGTNPTGGSITMYNDGTYTFTSTTPGVFVYYVPVCLPAEASPCTPVELTITVLTSGSHTNPPVANTDIASTLMNAPVSLKTLANDKCYNIGCTLKPSSVEVTVLAKNGTSAVNNTTGDNVYTPAAGFFGKDTLIYRMCDNQTPTQYASAKQIITVYAAGLDNTTLAADDYFTTFENQTTTGNVKLNDTDPENNSQAVSAQTVTSPGKGSLVLNTDGSFTFLPDHGYNGPVSFPYTICDNGTPSACANATLYILVIPISTPLAVNFGSLSSVQKNCTVQLKWTTRDDGYLRNYIIDNSTNGIDWVSIGALDAKGDVSRNDYSFLHNNPVKGQNYYRLTMTDKEGRKTFSTVLNSNVACSNVEVVVNPNPFTDKLLVQFTSEKAELVTINLFNDAGTLVQSNRVAARAGSNQVKLKDLQWLASGVYFIQVRTSGGILNQKLLK